MKRTRKLILALVVVMSLLMAMAVAIIPASAADAPAKTELYLTPNSNWKVDNARFAAYFFGNGETWVSMTKVNDNLYKVTIPTNKTYPNVIFCRMNPNASANNWNNKWNQTADLTIPSGNNNHYTVKDGTWDKGGGAWSHTCQYTDVVTAPTCANDGYTTPTCFCGKPGTVKDIVPSTGNHSYSTLDTDSKYQISGATCTDPAYYYLKCSGCNGFVEDENNIVPHGEPNGHTYTNGVCDTCGFKGTFFLVPNANWKVDNARFAAYFFGNGETWVSMTKVNDDLYKVVIPDGNWTGMIFCRMNPSANENNWDNKWNQTGDLVIPVTGNNNLFTVPSGSWNGATTTWSHYCHGGTASCTEKAECTVCHEKYGEALGHDHEACPHKAVVGDTYYESIKDAIANAESGTITLVDDVTYEDLLVIGENLSIDLNGHVLEATGLVTVSADSIIDSSAKWENGKFVEPTGLLIIPQFKLAIPTLGVYMPIWNTVDGEYGYQFVKMEDQQKVVDTVPGDDSFNVVFRPSIGDTAFNNKIFGDVENNGLEFVINVYNGTLVDGEFVAGEFVDGEFVAGEGAPISGMLDPATVATAYEDNAVKAVNVKFTGADFTNGNCYSIELFIRIKTLDENGAVKYINAYYTVLAVVGANNETEI